MRFASRRYLIALIIVLIPIVAAVVVSSRVTSAPPRLTIDLSARQLTVSQGGDVVATYPVAVGRASNPTPKGTYRTGRIEWNPDWTPPPRKWAKGLKPRKGGDPRNPMQGVKIYFREPWYYIHGTNDPGSIGSAASRGCVRMRPSDAVALAKRIQNNGGSATLVIKG